MDKKKILLVEDSKDDILLIQRAFNKTKLAEKFELIIAQDGNQALSYLHDLGISSISQQSKIPMILLLDLNLPKMNGFEILQRIRSNDKTKLIPVIVFTSSKEDQDITKSYLLGANSYVRKPIDSDKFTAVLQQIVSYWGDINELPVK
ncbi:MAG: response regulator [Candidatus Thermoplasmatota archaeon]|jgi:two-component system response regulator|nr:response regulator [Candidatus Thermoplasmatota archaeon]